MSKNGQHAITINDMQANAIDPHLLSAHYRDDLELEKYYAELPESVSPVDGKAAWVEIADLEARRKIEIRDLVHKKVGDFYKYLKEQKEPVFAQVIKDIGGIKDWRQLEEKLADLLIEKGKLWGDEPAQDELIEERTALGMSAQIDEFLFGLLNALTMTQGLLEVAGDTPTTRGVFWALSIIPALYGVYPDMFGINPRKQATGIIKPKLEIKKDVEFGYIPFQSARHAEFYRHALLVRHQLKEAKITPWKKNLGLTALGVASGAGTYALSQKYLDQVFDQEYYHYGVAAASAVLFMALAESGVLLKGLRTFTPKFNWIFFLITNFVGAVAQYIPVAEFYEYQIDWFGGNNNYYYSQIIKAIFSLTFYTAIFFFALKNSKMHAIKKYGAMITWFLLCLSLIIEKPDPSVKMGLSIAWTTFFFGPVGMSYYEFLSRKASDEWGEKFWTAANRLWQLFLINFWLGLESTQQLTLTSLIRGGGFSGLVAAYLITGYGYDKCPPWIMWSMLAVAFLSTFITRIPGLPAIKVFEIPDPFGIIKQIPSLELLRFKVDGIPAIEHKSIQPTSRQKVNQGVKSFLYGSSLGAGSFLYASSPNEYILPSAIGIFIFLFTGIGNYLGQVENMLTRSARDLIDKDCEPTAAEKAALKAAKEKAKALAKAKTPSSESKGEAKEEVDEDKVAKDKADRVKRLTAGGEKLAYSTLLANNIPRLLSSALLVAGFGLLNSKITEDFGNFKTVWLATLLIGYAARVADARMLFNSGFEDAIASIEESEDAIEKAKTTPPQGCWDRTMLRLHKIKYGIYGTKPEAELKQVVVVPNGPGRGRAGSGGVPLMPRGGNANGYQALADRPAAAPGT